MAPIVDSLFVLLILTNMLLLGSSRLAACVKIVAIQGVALGSLPLLLHSSGIDVRVGLVAAANLALKGIVFPWLLQRAIKGAKIAREVEPIISYGFSMLAGLVLLGVAFWLGRRLPLPPGGSSTLLLPFAFFTIFVGLFLTVSRKKAANQALGYLAMENGIAAFGLAYACSEPFLVELGVLLDAFMAVLVMGITIYQIRREFDSIDTDRLSSLRG